MNYTYLVHHGIKGQKWGVRRFQYDDGSRTPSGKQRYGNTSNIKRLLTSKHRLGSIERAQEKRDMLQAKIAQGGDKNFLYRNTVNDWRAGRAEAIGRKIAHRQAKLDYKKNKTTENYSKLTDARVKRLLYNGILVPAPDLEGRYKRQRQNGKSVVDAALIAGLGTVALSLVIGGLVGGSSSTDIYDYN